MQQKTTSDLIRDLMSSAAEELIIKLGPSLEETDKAATIKFLTAQVKGLECAYKLESAHSERLHDRLQELRAEHEETKAQLAAAQETIREQLNTLRLVQVSGRRLDAAQLELPAPLVYYVRTGNVYWEDWERTILGYFLDENLAIACRDAFDGPAEIEEEPLRLS